MGQKVTFYNEISIQEPVGGDNKIPGNSSNLSSNGIYFTPANDIFQNQKPPHIVQGQYIYTLGSRIINNTEEEPKSIVSSQIEDNQIIFTTNDDSYFVSKVESNEFNKTITVTKSAIDLSGITIPLKNIVNSIKSTDSSIRINDTTIRLYYDEDGLKLSNSTLQPNNIHIINDYKTNSYLTLETDNIVRIFAYTELEVSIPNKYNNYLTVEDLTTNLEAGYKFGKVIKLKTKGTGWDDTYPDSYTFSGFTISAEENETYISANQNNYSFELKKVESPFTFNTSKNKYDVTQSSFDLLNITSDYITTPNYTKKSLYDGVSSYCVVNDTDKTISIQNAYYITDASYVTITITDNTNPTDIYYTTNKDFDLYFSGAKQWELVFNDNNETTTKQAYYNKAFEFPTTPIKEGYQFDGWYTEQTDGTNVITLKAGASGYTWNNYSTTLYAHWTENVKYYWYVGTDNPVNMTPPSVGDANATLCKWTLLESKPTEIAVYKSDENWNEYRWYIAIPEEYGYSIYDNANNNITAQFIKTVSTIAGVKYAIYQTNNLMDTIDVKVK